LSDYINKTVFTRGKNVFFAVSMYGAGHRPNSQEKRFDSRLFREIESRDALKQRNYSVACGTPKVARELVSAFLVSMPHGERPGKCRNKEQCRRAD
jgi:hypothetical protein